MLKVFNVKRSFYHFYFILYIFLFLNYILPLKLCLRHYIFPSLTIFSHLNLTYVSFEIDVNVFLLSPLILKWPLEYYNCSIGPLSIDNSMMLYLVHHIDNLNEYFFISSILKNSNSFLLHNMGGIKKYISSKLILRIHYGRILDKPGGKATLYAKVPTPSKISNSSTNWGLSFPFFLILIIDFIGENFKKIWLSVSNSKSRLWLSTQLFRLL